MNSRIPKILLTLATIACVPLLVPASAVETTRKVYSQQERNVEEARILKDIESKLDWRNRGKDSLDDNDDEQRLLYSKLNESILLRSSTGERFGIFESFDQANTKRFEIRLHRKNKVTDRFLSGSVYCDAIALSADKVASEYVLFREICYRNNIPTHTLYIFDYASRGLYWLYSNEVEYSKKPAVSLKNGTYRIKWNVKTANSTHSVDRSFMLVKSGAKTWRVKPVGPLNAEADDIAAEETLSLDEKYDLPTFVASWGTR